MEQEEMPKGMTKLPEEYYNVTDENVNHAEINYSKVIRDVLNDLEGKGIKVNIQKMEIAEHETQPTLVSIIMTVGKP